MLYLLDTSDDLAQAEAEIGGPVGQLITPLTRRKNEGRTFAIDNGAFARFERDNFVSLLERELPNRERCLFVAVPDVVGSARRTLEVFAHWHSTLERWPLALVCQDGQEDLPIPWELIAAVFIGGSTAWKMSAEAKAICKAAKAIGKHVHVGRVNTPDRLQEFSEIADSVDGTGISRYSWMRKRIANNGQELFNEVAEGNS